MLFSIVDRHDENSRQVRSYLIDRLEAMGWIYDEDKCEIVICVGGDGTLLRAIHQYLDKLDKINFVAIHTGTLGFFTDYTQDEIDIMLDDIQNNEPMIEAYSLLEMYVPEKNQYHYAINEIRIQSSLKTLSLDIYIDDEFFENSNGSGVCVSTQLGSTAINRALQGAVIDPGLSVMQLCEIMPITHKAHHSLRNPYIMKESRKLTICGRSLTYAKACFDHLEIDLDGISEINIRSSNKKVRFARFRTYSYLKRLKSLY